jgi:hypothetical protein
VVEDRELLDVHPQADEVRAVEPDDVGHRGLGFTGLTGKTGFGSPLRIQSIGTSYPWG